MPDPWTVSRDTFPTTARLHHHETIFTIGNGYLSTRGAFEEGYPSDHRATFAHGVFDAAPAVATELVNMPDWLPLDVLLNGDRFTLATGEVEAFSQELDLATGLLSRRVRWRSPSGAVATLLFERFASLDDPHVMLVRCTVRPEFDGVLEFRAALDGHTENVHPGFRVSHLEWVDQGAREATSFLVSRTRTSGIAIATAMQVVLAAGVARHAETWDATNRPTRVLVVEATRGTDVTVEKHVAIVTSRDVQAGQLVDAAVEHVARVGGWQTAFDASSRAWAAEWERTDVVIEGDDEAQLAVRFNLFQLLIAAPRHDERVNIGAKTLSGFGYRGHAFWDTETFMLPVFTYTAPDIARNLLNSRWHQLGAARARARAGGFDGARFPWESADTGDEVTPPWLPDPSDLSRLVRIWAGDLEIHISADIAFAAHQYWEATGDDDWYASRGAEMILDTAAWWASRAEWMADRAGGTFGYRDVIGPDEYHEHVDNNHFTNRLARWNLRAGLATAAWLRAHAPERWDQLRRTLGLSEATLARWGDVAGRMYLPVLPTGLIEQFDGYLALEDIDLAALEPRTRSVQVILGVEGVNRTQAVKQPDVLMAVCMLPAEFSDMELAANYAYYAPRTDHSRGSSLGPSVMAILASRVGRSKEAHQHFMRGALADLLDVRGNAGDGIHGASAGGIWQAVVFGFAGLRVTAEGWETHPALPQGWTRLSFRFFHGGELQVVDMRSPGPAPSS